MTENGQKLQIVDLGLLNTILKFADDTKIFGKVLTPADRLQLQTDLDNYAHGQTTGR